MAVTLRDVAERAQVSVRTVSNVVSGYTHVSARMRERVNAAIDDLGYRPNPVARTLRTGRSGILALVVPEIDVPYFSELARHVIREAAGHGYRVLIDPTEHDHERERELLVGNERTMLFDGMLFSPLATRPELLAERSPDGPPLVLLGEHEYDGTYDHVAIDNVRAAHDAVAHLIETGRTRISAIGAQPLEQYSTPQQRRAGYATALTEAGLEPNEDWLMPATHYSRAEGYEAATALMKMSPRPDAIFCFSDLLAIGAMRAVHDAGLAVPGDVAVVGIDNIEEGQFGVPSLTSVSLDTPFLAREAVRHVVRRMDDPDAAATEVVAPHELIVRESSARGLA